MVAASGSCSVSVSAAAASWAAVLRVRRVVVVTVGAWKSGAAEGRPDRSWSDSPVGSDAASPVGSPGVSANFVAAVFLVGRFRAVGLLRDRSVGVLVGLGGSRSGVLGRRLAVRRLGGRLLGGDAWRRPSSSASWACRRPRRPRRRLPAPRSARRRLSLRCPTSWWSSSAARPACAARPALRRPAGRPRGWCRWSRRCPRCRRACRSSARCCVLPRTGPAPATQACRPTTQSLRGGDTLRRCVTVVRSHQPRSQGLVGRVAVTNSAGPRRGQVTTWTQRAGPDRSGSARTSSGRP